MPALIGFSVIALLGITSAAAWLTHVIVAISALTGAGAISVGYGILLAVGCVIPPVGVIHGVGVWFGAF